MCTVEKLNLISIGRFYQVSIHGYIGAFGSASCNRSAALSLCLSGNALVLMEGDAA